MKLLIVAALASVAAAARLEHLERGYLPPDHSHGQAGFGSQGFGSQGFDGSGSSHGSYDSNGIDSAGAGTRPQGFASSAFPGAISNQYLPPDHGPSGPNSRSQYSGSLPGFQRPQPFGGSQYPSNQYGSASNGFAQSRYQQQYPSGGSQFAATNRRYLAPKASSFQNVPQQPFDEQTGYIY